MCLNSLCHALKTILVGRVSMICILLQGLGGLKGAREACRVNSACDAVVRVLDSLRADAVNAFQVVHIERCFVSQ